jgi:hypothetical protein
MAASTIKLLEARKHHEHETDQGHLKEAEGKIRQVTGKLVGNEHLPVPISRTTSRSSLTHE